jgi:phage shock protein PspC (stress-responsive transcriptional regulator)
MDDTKTCPYCAEIIRAEAVKCRFCGSRVDRNAFARSWYRRRDGRKIGGVAEGLAAEWGVSVTLIRLAFVASLFMGGWGAILYLALWFIMPYEPEAPLARKDPPPVTPPTGSADRW